jgi:heat shock protein HtpX
MVCGDWNLFCLANPDADGRPDSRREKRGAPAAARLVSLAVVRAGRGDQVPRVSISGDDLIIDMDLPIGQPGMALRCRIATSVRDASLQRHLHRAGNHRRSSGVISGMVLLLAVCGYIVGGEEGAKLAVRGGTPAPGGPIISRAVMEQQFGARMLRPADMPAVFAILGDICRRAGLRRLPDLYYLAGPHSMNAYALGGPDGSAITLTEGLLRGMTLGEIAGILAHEVAHIRNNDAFAMTWASALHRATSLTSLVAQVALHLRGGQSAMSGRLVPMLLASAPAIGQLLGLALSRIRELDADATALDLIDDPRSFVAALNKLEHHHTGSRVMAAAAPEEGLTRFLCSHPATRERVGILASLAY